MHLFRRSVATLAAALCFFTAPGRATASDQPPGVEKGAVGEFTIRRAAVENVHSITVPSMNANAGGSPRGVACGNVIYRNALPVIPPTVDFVTGSPGFVIGDDIRLDPTTTSRFLCSFETAVFGTPVAVPYTMTMEIWIGCFQDPQVPPAHTRLIAVSVEVDSAGLNIFEFVLNAPVLIPPDSEVRAYWSFDTNFAGPVVAYDTEDINDAGATDDLFFLPTGSGFCQVINFNDFYDGFWVILRAVDSVPDGACCNVLGGCETTFESACIASGGVFKGNFSTCAETNCLAGACCDGLDQNNCQVLDADVCQNLQPPGRFTFVGFGTTCDPNPCPPVGACCVDANCSIGPMENCAGFYLGDGTDCSGDPCATGACCDLDTSECTITDFNDCVFNLSRFYVGAGTVCDPEFCGFVGACCVDDGSQFSCSEVNEEHCVSTLGGHYLGDGFECVEQATGAERCDCNLNGDIDFFDVIGLVGAVDNVSLLENAAIPDPLGVPAPPVTVSWFNPEIGIVRDVNLGVEITHTWVADLQIILSHNGVSVNVFDDQCRFRNDLNVVFDDEAGLIECGEPTVGTFAPLNPLSAFDGIEKHGLWELAISDDFTGDQGTLVSWTLRMTSSEGPPTSTDCNDNFVPDECEDPNPTTGGACCMASMGVCMFVTPDQCAAIGGVYFDDCRACEEDLCANTGEECWTAETIFSLPFSKSFDNSESALSSGNPSGCNTGNLQLIGEMRKDVWFRLSPMENCVISASIATSSYDGILSIHEGDTCTTMNEVACARSPGTIELQITADHQYWFQLGARGNDTGGKTQFDLFCLPPTGACCTPTLTCEVLNQQECDAVAGQYQGNDIPCDAGACDDLFGACCDPALGLCAVMLESDCVAAQGVYQSPFAECEPSPCGTTIVGACCVNDAGEFVCSEVRRDYCENVLAGAYLGDRVPCIEADRNIERCDCNSNGVLDDVDTLGTGGVLIDIPAGTPIPGDGSPLILPFDVPNTGTITDVNVGLRITHAWLADLEVEITHDGVTVSLLDDQCGGPYTVMDIELDDEGSPIHCAEPTVGHAFPRRPLAAFDGMNMSGMWTLSIRDDSSGALGTIDAWSLRITSLTGPPTSSDCNHDRIPDECETPDPTTVGACCDPNTGLCELKPANECISGARYLGDCRPCESGICESAGDSCHDSVIASSLPFTLQFDNSVMSNSHGPGGSCNTAGAQAAGMDNDAWFRFTSEINGDLIATFNADGYDGLMTVYHGTFCNDLTEMVCIDSPDDPGSFTFPATAGETYWFQIGDRGTVDGGGPTNLTLARSGLTGDVNCDDAVNFLDVESFVQALIAPKAYIADHPECDIGRADLNGDSSRDGADIQPFIERLLP